MGLRHTKEVDSEVQKRILYLAHNPLGSQIPKCYFQSPYAKVYHLPSADDSFNCTCMRLIGYII